MPHARDHPDHWKRVIDDMIARSTATAPTVPGLYRMPCGRCYVDFFTGSDGAEHWLVPGEATSYTRERVAIARHGDYPWERMYTLAQAAIELRRRAGEDHIDHGVLLEQLATREEEDAAEEEEIARIVRERTATGESTPLADIARHFGVDLDDL